MFLIPSDRPPESLAELRRLLLASLEQTYRVSDVDRRLRLTGRWPRLDEVQIDLTDVTVDPRRLPPTPGRFAPPAGPPAWESARLQISADPLCLGARGQLRFSVTAGHVDLSFVRDAHAQLWLLPHHFASGHVAASIAGSDLEGIFLEGAQTAAARHGVSIEDGNLQLTQADPRSVRISAELEARRLFVRGRLALRGRVAVDRELHLCFSELTCEGRGAIGSIASRFLRPHLEAWEDQSIPLLAMALPAVRLHHAALRTEADGRLHATAEFGEDTDDPARHVGLPGGRRWRIDGGKQHPMNEHLLLRFGSRPLTTWLLAIALVAATGFAAPVDRQTAGPLSMTTDHANGRLTILHRDRPVLRYAFAADQWKPYVEELYSLAGHNVTIDSPPDHLHHHGLMYTITVNGINFWEEYTDPGLQQSRGFLARELHHPTTGPALARLEQLIHWVEGRHRQSVDSSQVALLIEQRRLTVTVDEAGGEVAVRWQSAFTVGPAAEQAQLSGAIYHGLGIRMPAAFDRVARRLNSAGLPYSPAGGNEVTPARWTAMTHPIDGQPLTIAMFDHPSNARSGVFFSMLNSFAYLSATQALDQQPLVYRTGERFALDYLVTVCDREQSATELAARYDRWLGQP